MARKKPAKRRLVPEDELARLRPEAERLADEQDYAFPALAGLPFYPALVHYMMFVHLRDDLGEKLGRLDDRSVWANAFFWGSVVFEYSHRLGPGLNPLADEPTMDHIEGAPTLHFTEQEYLDLIRAAEAYVAARPLSRGEKAAARKMLSDLG